jgi:hypothetical protein
MNSCYWEVGRGTDYLDCWGQGGIVVMAACRPQRSLSAEIVGYPDNVFFVAGI